MHKYEDYIDIVDGDEMKEDEIDCIVCGALEKLKAHDEVFDIGDGRYLIVEA